MGMSGGGSGAGPRSDINVTPLVDVLLVLLIIFMVVVAQTMGQRGYDIEIPKESQSTAAPDPSAPKNVMLSINDQDCNATTYQGPASNLPRDCKVRINNDLYGVNDMGRALSDIYKARSKSERILFLAAQHKMNYEAVVRILDVAKAAVGEDLKIAIVSDEKFAFPQAK